MGTHDFVDWWPHDEAHAETLVAQAVNWLVEHDFEAFKRAVYAADPDLVTRINHAVNKDHKEALAKGLKYAALEAAKLFVPGIGTAMSMAEPMATMKLYAVAGNVLFSADGAKLADTQPVNALANMLADVCRDRAKEAGNEIIISGTLGYLVTAATAAGGIGMDEAVHKAAEPINLGLHKAAESLELGIRAALDFVHDKSFKKGEQNYASKYGVKAFLIYLAAKPRKTINNVEICRLALRAILGFHPDGVNPTDGGFLSQAKQPINIVTPEDVVYLLSDGYGDAYERKATQRKAARRKGLKAQAPSGKVIPAMEQVAKCPKDPGCPPLTINGVQKDKNLRKLDSFVALGEVDPAFNPADKARRREKSHITYLVQGLDALGKGKYHNPATALDLEKK